MKSSSRGSTTIRYHRLNDVDDGFVDAQVMIEEIPQPRKSVDILDKGQWYCLHLSHTVISHFEHFNPTPHGVKNFIHT